ncbi:hypothetical protein J4G02_18725 [Candidatus Poribacteria bacterium]|nr:hypothetical protein [Candidatus Poribacteria bacterium]
MKKLSLLIFAILILGCGTETTIVEEPPAIIEEPTTVVAEEEPILPPKIVESDVHDGDVDVDPKPLNHDGIILRFTEPLNMYAADLRSGADRSLAWSPRDVVEWDIGNQAHLMPMADSQLLEYDTEYWLSIYAQGFACNGALITMRFRTKPR